MSIRMQATAPRLDLALQKLEQYPVVSDKYHRVALRASVGTIAGMIEPDIPTATGTARETFATRVGVESMGTEQDKAFGEGNVTGFGTQFLVGRVGWFGRTKGWYINIVEHGAKAHLLTDREGPAHVNIGGRWVTMYEHRGFPGRNFFRSKEGRANAVVNAEMATGAQSILRALSVGGTS